MDIDTAPDLDALLAKWRWLVPADVDVQIKWADDLEEGDLAQCSPRNRLLRLLIKVEPYSPTYEVFGFELSRDVESDVVHELLHYRFELFTPEHETSAYESWEAAVERTAQDLIRLDRRKLNA